MQPYIYGHFALIVEESNVCTEEWVMKQHRQRLTTWLKDHQNLPNGGTKDEITIRRLARWPPRQVTSWQAYEINGYTYYTHAKDNTFVNQNSSVRVEALDGLG
jgi:hypothetical protein